MDLQEEKDFCLCELGLRARSKFFYLYDFGDSWEHEIAMEKVVHTEAEFVLTCLEGERACPPEDSGGIWSYTEKLEIMGDPKAPDHDEIVEWMGEDFDPLKFEVDAVNQRLQKLAASWKKRKK